MFISSVKFVVVAIWVIGARVAVVQGFTPMVAPSTWTSRVVHTASSSSSPRTTIRHQAFVDPSSILDVGSLILQPSSPVMDGFFTSSLNLAADTAAAASTTDGGWWEQYINIFKVGLEFVHGAVDGPLRSIGIEQTWGISIALFTASIRSLLIPLSIQQSKSAEYMKALRPYQAQIREKYKGNEQLQNRALGKLYEDAEQNPLAGCLFSLAQLPVFLGLYRGIRTLARDNELQEPFLFIPSLEGPVSPPNYQGLDWLVQGWTNSIDNGLPIPPLGWETTIAFLIMPVVLVVLQGITMQILQPPIDDSMGEEEKEQLQKTQVVFKFLPLLIGFFSLQVPAGLTIYWFTSNVFTLSQSLAVRAYFAANPPQIELPDYWDQTLKGEEMSPEERRKASEAGLRVGPTFEELIDEAKFHSFIERQPLRAESPAWQRVETSSSSSWNIPPEFEAWVKEGKKGRSTSIGSRETTVQVEAAT